MRARRRSFHVSLATLTLALAACGGPKPAPTDYPPLPAVARATTEADAPVEVLLVRSEYRFDEAGRYTRTFRDRYRILNEDGVEGWGSTEARWSPWHQKKPRIAATVTSAAGVETKLDPAALAESTAYPNAPDLYGDERMLRAPLPNLGPGALVDEEITYETHRAYVGGGEVFELPLQLGVARQRVEIVVDMPAEMPFQYQLRDAVAEVRDETKGDRRVVTISGGPYPGVKPVEPAAPSDVAEWPTVAFTTAKSWKTLAKEYARIVDEKLAGANLEGVVAKIVQPGDSVEVKASKLLAWAHDRVRYVAVEFGDSSVVPRTPDETLKHGYGDCKDQAVLLVGLLRAAHVPAQVALLRAGLGEDVAPTLPGLNVFNHAIVRVGGKAPLWLDPTATRARAGELPSQDQGRWALPIADDVDALARTPHADHDANGYRETRQIFLAEYGSSRVVETLSASGAIERTLREDYDVDAAALAKWHKTYVSKTYSSEQPGKLETSNPKDLSTPFAMTVEAKASRYAVTGLVDASTWLDPTIALTYVPRSLSSGDDRRADYALAVPYDATIVFEVHPPPGFTVDEKPAPRELALGPAKYRQGVELRADGTVVVTATFSLPKERWTPTEVMAFRKAYATLVADKRPEVSFVHAGERLHRARAYDKELAAYRAELAKQPASSLAKLRLAVSLRNLGFGLSARKLADEVVKTGPTDVDLWNDVGFIRTADRFGRPDRPGWDRAGAIEVYREALKRNPENLYATVNLAVLYEYDAKAVRYGQGAQLDDAIALLEKVPTEKLASYDNGGWPNNLLYDLMWAGRYQAVRDRTKTLTAGKVAEVPVIVSAAMLGGANAGLAEANRLAIPDERKNATLVSAADTLIQLRRYPEASALLGAAAATSSDPQLRNRVGVIAKTKVIDVRALPVAKPAELALKGALLCTVQPETLGEDLAAITSPRLVAKKGDKPGEAFCGTIKPPGSSEARARGVLGDVMAAMWEASAEGSDELGYRVTLKLPSVSMHTFVVQEGKTPRLRASEERPAELGCEALSAWKAGKKAQATQWLTWAKDLFTAASGDDPLRETPFRRLWTDKKDDVEASAAALCAYGGHADVVVPVLTAARATATGERAGILSHAIALAYADGEHDAELLAAATKLAKDFPTSKVAWHLQRYALRKLGRFQELRDLAAERLAKEPSDPDMLDDLATAEDLLGHSKEARAAGDKLIATGRGGANAYNSQAWRSLFGGGIGDVEIGWALQAANQAPGNAGVLNTLAALDAEAGHVADGLEQFKKSIEAVSEPDLGDADWFVYGRLAEQLALPEDARAAYAKMGPPKRELGEHTVAKLAKKRLELLKL